MYGLIHQALQAHVEATWGEATWLRVLRRAGCSEAGFQCFDAYDDATTMSLLVALEGETGTPVNQTLRALGYRFVAYLEGTSFQSLLRATGQDLPEFIGNLDLLHNRVRVAFPALRPPSFRVSEVSHVGFLVHYQSSRDGLVPLVEGLLAGVAARFGVAVVVSHETARTVPGGSETFRVQYAQGQD